MIEMWRLTAILTFIIFVFSPVCVNGQEVDKNKDQSHHFYAGINLATPFGTYLHDRYKYPLSYISSNLNLGGYLEYRYSILGLKIPFRIPITHLNEENFEVTQSSYGGYYDLYGLNYVYDTQFELGIKPVIYFNEPNESFQVYGGLGVYFGSHKAIDQVYYNTYDPDGTGLYVDYSQNPKLPEYSLSDPWSYQRYSLVSGIQIQFDNGFGINSDIEIFYGTYKRGGSIRYTNYNTTDGVYYVDYQYNGGSRRRIAMQFNFCVTYKIL